MPITFLGAYNDFAPDTQTAVFTAQATTKLLKVHLFNSSGGAAAVDFWIAGTGGGQQRDSVETAPGDAIDVTSCMGAILNAGESLYCQSSVATAVSLHISVARIT